MKTLIIILLVFFVSTSLDVGAVTVTPPAPKPQAYQLIPYTKTCTRWIWLVLGGGLYRL